MPLHTQDLFAKIRRIQMLSTQLANDIFAGAYRSIFKGRGMEFEEVREYQPGDEVRYIDWNVTARMNSPFVKNFREEREIAVMLVIDVSGSTHFGSQEAKSDLIAELSAVLAFSAIKNQDKVGLILFSDGVEKYLPPRKGTRHVLRVIREILAYQPQQRSSDIKSALSFLGKIPSHRGICFLISDFICPDYSHEAALIAKKYDLIAISMTDPHENHFPEIGFAHIADLESGQHTIVNTASDAIQNHFPTVAMARIDNNRRLMQKIGADFIDIRTNQPFLPEMTKFFKLREKRRAL